MKYVDLVQIINESADSEYRIDVESYPKSHRAYVLHVGDTVNTIHGSGIVKAVLWNTDDSTGNALPLNGSTILIVEIEGLSRQMPFSEVDRHSVKFVSKRAWLMGLGAPYEMVYNRQWKPTPPTEGNNQ